MFIKFFALPFPLLLFLSMSCLAETPKVRSSEPESQYLGMNIDVVGRDFVDSFSVAPGKFLLIDKALSDVRIKKDEANGLNKFYALVAYNLRVNNAKPSATRFLYLQCPVTRITYLDRSPPPKKEMIDGEMRLVYSINHEVLSKEFLDSGSYSFLSSPTDKVPQLSKEFPMSGKLSQITPPLELLPLEAMCAKIQLTYAEYLWSETFRKITLKKFGILE